LTETYLQYWHFAEQLQCKRAPAMDSRWRIYPVAQSVPAGRNMPGRDPWPSIYTHTASDAAL